VKPNLEQAEARAVECDVAAHARVCVPLESLPDLRRQPGPPSSPPLPTNFLKHLDEQTVAGLSAVYYAAHNHGLSAADFTRWAVLGAPRFPGRAQMILSVKHFVAEGAWGVSPHMVPYRSLHSLSGTISQALKIHGPNFGVGGGNSAADEVVFAALALLERRQTPGAWVVVTAQEPEDALDDDGHGLPDKCVRALALALTPTRAGWRGLRLRLEMERATQPPPRPDYFKLWTMLEQLGEHAPGKSVTQPLQGCARLTLEWARDAVAAHPGHPHPGPGPFSRARLALPSAPAETHL
jgi:hypothetical protein